MKICLLGSGSNGNACFVEADGRRLLIDAGLGPKILAARLRPLGVAASDLTDVLLTHEHSDHVRGLASLVKRAPGVVVHATRGTLTGLDPDIRHRVRVFATSRVLKLGDLRVTPFAVSHDGREPVGFRLEGSHSVLGYATDLGSYDDAVVRALSGVDALVIESNHCPVRLARGPYPQDLKRRVAGPKGHLSNQDSNTLVRALLHPGLKYLAFAHLSGVNNTPEEVRATHAPLLAGLGPSAWAVGRRDGAIGAVSLPSGDPAPPVGQLDLGL
jgi:phosphoribosyl 1,2-cyclic phosphodiesterase